MAEARLLHFAVFTHSGLSGCDRCEARQTRLTAESHVETTDRLSKPGVFVCSRNPISPGTRKRQKPVDRPGIHALRGVDRTMAAVCCFSLPRSFVPSSRHAPDATPARHPWPTLTVDAPGAWRDGVPSKADQSHRCSQSRSRASPPESRARMARGGGNHTTAPPHHRCLRCTLSRGVG